MFNVFKKNLKGTIENQCSEENVILTPEVEEVVQDQTSEVKNFISAKEALEKATSKWKFVSTEKIFEGIKKEAEYGEKKVTFYNSFISDEQKEILEELGYQVKIDKFNDGTPYFKVFW